MYLVAVPLHVIDPVSGVEVDIRGDTRPYVHHRGGVDRVGAVLRADRVRQAVLVVMSVTEELGGHGTRVPAGSGRAGGMYRAGVLRYGTERPARGGTVRGGGGVDMHGEGG